MSEVAEKSNPKTAEKTDTKRAGPVGSVVKKLSPPRFKQAEMVRNQWSIVVEVGTIVDDVLDRSFWQNVAINLRPGDRIEVLTDDMKWAADMVVHSCGRLWANVKIIGIVQFSDIIDYDAVDKLTVQYRGPHHRYCVVDNENKNNPDVVKHGFADQETAMIFLQEYRKTSRKVA